MRRHCHHAGGRRLLRRQRRATAAAGPGSPGVPSLEVCPRAPQPALAAGAGMEARRRRRSERRRRHGSSWALSPAAAPRHGRRRPWQPRCALAGGLPEGAPARPGRGGGHGGAQAPPQRAPAILTSPAWHERHSTQNPKIRANDNRDLETQDPGGGKGFPRALPSTPDRGRAKHSSPRGGQGKSERAGCLLSSG